VRRILRAAWLFAFLLGCAQSPHEINDVLAAHKTSDRYVDTPKSSALREWEVGQWVLYKLSTAGRIGYVKHSVVGWTKCGVWLETLVVLGDYEDHTVFKVCFRKQPDARVLLDEQTKLFEAFMSKRSDRVTAIDLGKDRERKQSLDMVLRMIESFPIVAARGAAGSDRHEIVVRAGQFAGVRDVPARMRINGKLHAVVISFHSEVPLGGVLEATATDDDDAKVLQVELLDYGLTGAKSELPDFDEYTKSVE
jgi:hypothetical protein